jgi:hypothetical protein
MKVTRGYHEPLTVFPSSSSSSVVHYPSSQVGKVASKAYRLGIPEEGVEQRSGIELASNSKTQQYSIPLKRRPSTYTPQTQHARSDKKNPIRIDSANPAGETIPRYHCAIDNATLSGP